MYRLHTVLFIQITSVYSILVDTRLPMSQQCAPVPRKGSGTLGCTRKSIACQQVKGDDAAPLVVRHI